LPNELDLNTKLLPKNRLKKVDIIHGTVYNPGEESSVTMGKVKVGCCGFPRGMKRYFSQFRLVEVQQTFYKPPKI